MGTRGIVAIPGFGSVWDQMSPFKQYGVVAPDAPALAAARPGTASPGIARSAGPSGLDRNDTKPWHPDNPLFWFGLIAAATVGFAGVSFSAHLGPARAGAALGTS